MDLTKIRATLGGQEINLPEEWQGLQILANFEPDLTQANIDTEEFTFVLEARKLILEHIEEGRLYEGIPLELQLSKGNNNYIAFDGFLNLQKTFLNLVGSDKVSSKIAKLDGLNTLDERLSGISFGYLDSLGLVKSEDVQYLVEKRKPFIEIVVTALMIYLMIKEIAEIQRRLTDNIVSFVGLLTGGGAVNSSIGAALLLAGKIIIDLAYAVLLIKAIIEMVEELLNSFISPVRTYKVCSYFELMRSACEYLGYEFSSSITHLQNAHFLPSNPLDEGITTGVPRASDSGYICGEFFNIMENLYSAKLAIIDNTVYFENKDSDFWIRNSTYNLPSVFIQQKRKNGDELAGTRLVSFSTDPVDDFTIQNSQGNHYEILTTLTDYKYGEEYLTIDAVDDRLIPYARVARKNNLSDLEKILLQLGQLADSVVNLFGGNSNLAGKVQERVGMV